MNQGLGSSRYAAPDYEKLKALALEKKIAGNRTLMKVRWVGVRISGRRAGGSDPPGPPM